MSVANKQLEIMGRYMAELGITPSARARVSVARPDHKDTLQVIRVLIPPGNDNDDARRDDDYEGEAITLDSRL